MMTNPNEAPEPPKEFTLCEETGLLADRGACPEHGGDNCLRQYEPVGHRPLAPEPGERERLADFREALKDLSEPIGDIQVEMDPDRMRETGHIPDEAKVWQAAQDARRAFSRLSADLRAADLLRTEPGGEAERAVTRGGLEQAVTKIIRAENDNSDLRHSRLGMLQIALEALGILVDVRPPVPVVEELRAAGNLRPTTPTEPED